MLRFWLILMLVWQPLSLQAIGAATGPANGMIPPGCCEVIETVSCCGAPVVEMRCGMTGGECLCDMVPARSEKPAPALPITNPTERIVVSVEIENGFALDMPDGLRSKRPGIQGRPVRPSNTTRAILGIWRT